MTAGKTVPELTSETPPIVGTDELVVYRSPGPLKRATTATMRTYMAAGSQPLDADLTAIAALTSAADKMPYATGAQTWALADLTSFARSLLATANNSAFLAALGQIASSFVDFLQSGTGAVTRTVQSRLRDTVSILDFIPVAEHAAIKAGTSTYNCTAALQAAILAIRGASTVLSTDGLGSGSITVYQSSVIDFPEGLYRLTPDVLQITQDYGLTIRGRGSRRANNSIRGRTILLFEGTSSGYGFQFKGNGARGFTCEDVDICYEVAGFTGDVLDFYSTPGVYLIRVFMGTYGTTGGTRLQTARSCVRLTYDEFFHPLDCVFDGAVDLIWSDDTREPSLAFSDFGGSLMQMDNPVFYDATNNFFKHSGTRTRSGVLINNMAANPISVSCVRALDLNNVKGLVINAGKCQGSTTFFASTEWFRLIGCEGVINGTSLGALTKAGTISGSFSIRSVRCSGTDGITLLGGALETSGCVFACSGSGLTLSPTSQLTAVLGPDEFRSSATYSYDIPSDNAFLSVEVRYDPDADASTNRWRNVSARVIFRGVGEKILQMPTATYTPTRADAGRVLRTAINADPHVINLPTEISGLPLTFMKLNTSTLTVNAPGAGRLLTGTGASKTTLTFAAGDVGGRVSVQAIDNYTWFVTNAHGVITQT
jgi:hypothetical protein